MARLAADIHRQAEQEAHEAPPRALPSPRSEEECAAARKRKPAATPIAAVCQGVANACKCPEYTAAMSGTGRAEVLATGSFSGAFTEALVSVMMCESHANNFGGTVLVRKTAEGWTPTQYVAGFVPSHCELRRGSEGIDRLACLESYGLNQGTYSTSASVVDFAAQRYAVLLDGLCEDAHDVKRVAWLWPSGTSLDVVVSVEHGERRDNQGSACTTVGGKPVLSKLSYGFAPSGYVPSPETKTLLARLVPPSDEPVDPAVLEATGSPPSDLVPRELLPTYAPLDARDVGPCPDGM